MLVAAGALLVLALMVRDAGLLPGSSRCSLGLLLGVGPARSRVVALDGRRRRRRPRRRRGHSIARSGGRRSRRGAIALALAGSCRCRGTCTRRRGIRIRSSTARRTTVPPRAAPARLLRRRRLPGRRSQPWQGRFNDRFWPRPVFGDVGRLLRHLVVGPGSWGENRCDRRVAVASERRSALAPDCSRARRTPRASRPRGDASSRGSRAAARRLPPHRRRRLRSSSSARCLPVERRRHDQGDVCARGRAGASRCASASPSTCCAASRGRSRSRGRFSSPPHSPCSRSSSW